MPVAGSAYTYKLRDDGRARGLDHRLGPDPRVRGRQHRGRDLLGRSTSASSSWGWASRSPRGWPPTTAPRSSPSRAVAEGATLGPEMSIAYQAWQNHPVIFGVPARRQPPRRPRSPPSSRGCSSAGVKESARFNNAVVVLKVATLLFFIAVGTLYVTPANWTPFLPRRLLRPSGTAPLFIFFAYIGFDAISTAAEECKDPGAGHAAPASSARSSICTVLYVAAAPRAHGNDPLPRGSWVSPTPSPPPSHHVKQDWAAGVIALGAVVAMTAVLLVFQLGQAPHLHGDVARRAPLVVVRQGPPEVPHPPRGHPGDGGVRGLLLRAPPTSTRSFSSRTSGRSSRSCSSASVS